MIYICILLYALIAPFSYTFGSAEVSSDLTINIGGNDKIDTLQSSDYFASINTKVWLAEKVGNKFKYTLQDDIIKKANETFYEEKLNDDTNSEDYENFDPSDFEENAKSNEKPIQKKKEPEIKENTVYPEILVYVDKTIFEHFNYDIVKTVAYTLVLWNGVDFKFRQIPTPLIRLKIAGIVVSKDQLLPNKQFKLSNEVYEEFGKHMFRHGQFEFEKQHYNIAVWLAGSTKLPKGEQGRSSVATGCVIGKNKKILWSSAIIQDDFKLSGIAAAAHELAHLFGSANDGQKLKNWPGPHSKDCPTSDGYIMSNQIYGKNVQFFSSCTKNAIKYYFSHKRSKCFKSNTLTKKTEEQVLRILPGKYLTLDQQCEREGYQKAFNVTSEICTNLKCLTKENNAEYINVTALTGTPCDVGKYCMMGQCLDVKFNKNKGGVSSAILFPEPYKLPLEEVEVTTPVVEVTTPVVEVTTPVVEVTTHAVEVTTPVVEVTTPVVEVTTPVVEVTTPVVEVTTPVVEVTTHAVEVTTPAVEVTTPVVEVTTPVVEVTTPVVEVTTPVVEVTTPVVEVTTPVVEVTTPVVEVTTPVIEVTTPVVEVTTPVVEVTTPVVEVTTPVVEVTTPVVEVTTPVVEVTTPVVEVTTPVVEVTTPVVEVTTPVVEVTTPVVEVTTPVFEVTTPVVEVTTPVVEVTTPVVEVTTPFVEVTTPVVKVTTPNPKIGKEDDEISDSLKLADATCKKLGTMGVARNYTNECVFHCHVRHSGFEDTLTIQTINAPTGTKCSVNSHCEKGRCVKNVEEKPKVVPVSPDFKLADEECKKAGTYGAFNVSQNQCILNCKVAKSFYKNLVMGQQIPESFTPQTVNAQNGLACGEKSHCENGQCVLNHNTNSLLNHQFEWAEQHCKNSGFLGALKVSAHDCILKCKMPVYSLSDYFSPQKTCQVSIYPMAAPNKFPCSYKGVCLNNICVQVA
ncbi:uncharacterized protein LOC127280917 isoform X2 [Leptopilina boulardi]|uniref:uncharacterized protein LOC127280917 isoform X2 n=1 Tax=Leptopilina boulardi TaxID=63433 RepID=UPI0021F5154B|nr:uncharacterized protein LOC127280917 isoform X2 [Leptopilina boulardi]